MNSFRTLSIRLKQAEAEGQKSVDILDKSRVLYTATVFRYKRERTIIKFDNRNKPISGGTGKLLI